MLLSCQDAAGCTHSPGRSVFVGTGNGLFHLGLLPALPHASGLVTCRIALKTLLSATTRGQCRLTAAQGIWDCPTKVWFGFHSWLGGGEGRIPGGLLRSPLAELVFCLQPHQGLGTQKGGRSVLQGPLASGILADSLSCPKPLFPQFCIGNDLNSAPPSETAGDGRITLLREQDRSTVNVHDLLTLCDYRDQKS